MNILNYPQQIISWLESRRIINLVLVLAYFFFILHMHDPMVHLSMFIESFLSHNLYNRVVEVVYLVFLAAVAGIIWKQLNRNTEHINYKVSYLAATILFVFIHSRFMFDSSIEVIHSFEFTLLTFLIFPLAGRFGAAVLFTLPFMLIDEWYQYILLYPLYNDYFDLNDIMMDTYGCGLAMLMLMIIGVKAQQSDTPFWKRPELIGLISLVILVLVAAKLCIIAPYMSQKCNNTLLVMNERNGIEPFLRLHPKNNIMFHVMKPVEGLIAITILHLFYLTMDFFRK